MNGILIVLPILTLLMFDLGLVLRPNDFMLVFKQPKAIIMGLAGQLILLPLLAFALAEIFHLEPLFYIGIMLIACCPGGSSSNVFSMLAKGDVALSVSLTALSSIITLFTVPIILDWTTLRVGEAVGIHLPIGNLLVQNLITMLIPILLGIGVRHYWPKAASRMEHVLSKIAFPALMLLAGIFFVQHHATIADNFGILGLCLTALILLAIGLSWCASHFFGLETREKRTIVIEVGMQNAAQAIAIASSPFIFNNGVIAIPAIIYALLMNVVLLTYVGIIIKRRK
ncbi:MAG: bile acid:sodium symporter family protein [Bacteroidales bacterium]|nr:bile acid:sodium symporter family protein [Bacteroidales bacterium]